MRWLNTARSKSSENFKMSTISSWRSVSEVPNGPRGLSQRAQQSKALSTNRGRGVVQEGDRERLRQLGLRREKHRVAMEAKRLQLLQPNVKSIIGIYAGRILMGENSAEVPVQQVVKNQTGHPNDNGAELNTE
jgi:hypothetical protein